MLYRSHGFTLVELMVALAIAVILITIGLPSFSEMIASNRVTSQTNDLVSALNTARYEAIRRGAPVCVKRVSGTAQNWAGGWRVFVDSKSNRTVASASYCSTEGTLIQTHDALTGGNTLTADASLDPAVRFNAMGVAVDRNDVGISGTFSLCRSDANSSKSKSISLSTTGMVSISSTAPTCS